VIDGIRDFVDRVRARVPEKQGLKLGPQQGLGGGVAVRARVPEKQGLKQDVEAILDSITQGPGASSRKTRIETLRPPPR